MHMTGVNGNGSTSKRDHRHFSALGIDRRAATASGARETHRCIHVSTPACLHAITSQPHPDAAHDCRLARLVGNAAVVHKRRAVCYPIRVHHAAAPAHRKQATPFTRSVRRWRAHERGINLVRTVYAWQKLSVSFVKRLDFTTFRRKINVL